ncbi:MAG: shikimate kinase [Duncaniella sp.]|nr:shikimate kinase [Duncaniella sp.]
MKTTFLIGYMGSGKTTLGRAVSARTGVRFIDLDDYIEQSEGCTIREIFATRGEAAFRDIERRALAEVCDMADTLVACGGGTPCFGDNMEVMNSRGLTVYLDAPHHSLLSRLKEGRAKRPLIASLSDDELGEFISTQLARRLPYYTRATLSFDSSRLEDPQQVAESVDRFLKLIGYGS